MTCAGTPLPTRSSTFGMRVNFLRFAGAAASYLWCGGALRWYDSTHKRRVSWLKTVVSAAFSMLLSVGKSTNVYNSTPAT